MRNFSFVLVLQCLKENIFKIEIDVRQALQSLAFKIYFACLGLFVKMAEPIGPNILWDFKLSQGRFMDAQNFKNLSLKKFGKIPQKNMMNYVVMLLFYIVQRENSHR